MNKEISENEEAASVVLAVGKKARLPDDGIVEVKGIKVRIEPVPVNLIDDVTSRIKDPDVPTFYNEDKEREEPNPNDPQYLRDCEEAEMTRNRAAMDAMVLFGIDLVEGLPEDDSWIKKLKYLERLERINLSNYDLDDELDREFLFKRYIVADANIIGLISQASGVSPEEVSRIEDSFPDN